MVASRGSDSVIGRRAFKGGRNYTTHFWNLYNVTLDVNVICQNINWRNQTRTNLMHKTIRLLSKTAVFGPLSLFLAG